MRTKTTLILLGILLVGLMIHLAVRGQNMGETMFIGLSVIAIAVAGKYIVGSGE